jgi:hypothetical protein
MGKRKAFLIYYQFRRKFNLLTFMDTLAIRAKCRKRTRFTEHPLREDVLHIASLIKV